MCCRITRRQRHFLLLTTLQALNAHVQNGQSLRSAYIILSHIQSSHMKPFFDIWRHAIVVQQLVQLQLLSSDQGVINRRSVVNGTGKLMDVTKNRQLLHPFWNTWMVSIFRLRDRQLSACKIVHDKIVPIGNLGAVLSQGSCNQSQSCYFNENTDEREDDPPSHFAMDSLSW